VQLLLDNAVVGVDGADNGGEEEGETLDGNVVAEEDEGDLESDGVGDTAPPLCSSRVWKKFNGLIHPAESVCVCVCRANSREVSSTETGNAVRVEKEEKRRGKCYACCWCAHAGKSSSVCYVEVMCQSTSQYLVMTESRGWKGKARVRW
jgi:hypothetical protein